MTAVTAAPKINIGMVGIKVPTPVPMTFHGFGGRSAPSSATTTMHGPEGVRFYTKQKMLTSRWATGIRAGAEYVMPTMRMAMGASRGGGPVLGLDPGRPPFLRLMEM